MLDDADESAAALAAAAPAEAAAAFFDAEPMPAHYEETQQRLVAFCDALTQRGADRPCVLVSSGGTTVPLERNTVRFLDNFSAGTRGSACAEHFIAQGYDVVFLTRRFSMQPFSRHVMPSVHNVLELFAEAPDGSLRLARADADETHIRQMFRAWQGVVRDGRLLTIEFVTVSDYLWLLRAACRALAPLGSRVCVFLAAAVSDFYVPTAAMAVHKIQSSDGPLDLHLDRVPKMLGLARSQWCPAAMFISFKLETDEHLLEQKARRSLAVYSMHGVAANLLQHRKDQIVLFTHDAAVDIRRTAERPDLDLSLVLDVCRLHARHRDA